MEIANGPVPVAAVSYQKFIFFLMWQLAEVTAVKITIWHSCGTDYVCYNQISLQLGHKKLINESRYFHKHLHFCEISDKLFVHSDVNP